VDVHRDAERDRGEELQRLGAVPGGDPPFPRPARDALPGGDLEHGPLAVAANEQRTVTEPAHQCHRLVRLAAPGQVAAADDQVHGTGLDVGEHGGERRDVGVYVGDDRRPADRSVAVHRSLPAGGSVHGDAHVRESTNSSAGLRKWLPGLSAAWLILLDNPQPAFGQGLLQLSQMRLAQAEHVGLPADAHPHRCAADAAAPVMDLVLYASRASRMTITRHALTVETDTRCAGIVPPAG